MKASRFRLSVVSYLNSKPFLYGLEHHPIRSQIDLELDTPDICAEKLRTDQADIGLLPVAVLNKFNNYQILGDYCIGAIGQVGSVLLLSKVPLQEIQTILLDYQSNTSVMLVRILAERFWKINPVWVPGTTGYEDSIHGSTAGLVIGDRALAMRTNFPYIYDLSEAWYHFSGLPFVFACWASNKPIPLEIQSGLNTAFAHGVKHIRQVLETYGHEPLDSESAFDYLTNRISYEFDEPKKKGLQLFMKHLMEIPQTWLLKIK